MPFRDGSGQDAGSSELVPMSVGLSMTGRTKQVQLQHLHVTLTSMSLTHWPSASPFQQKTTLEPPELFYDDTTIFVRQTGKTDRIARSTFDYTSEKYVGKNTKRSGAGGTS
ncbi:MAG: hypothetical protein R2864_01160 [Syntrophotaleaceae bacterium]